MASVFQPTVFQGGGVYQQEQVSVPEGTKAARYLPYWKMTRKPRDRAPSEEVESLMLCGLI
jgi:hypothetical protein